MNVYQNNKNQKMSFFDPINSNIYLFNEMYKLNYITLDSYNLCISYFNDLKSANKINSKEFEILKNIFAHYYNNSIRIYELNSLRPRFIAQKFIGKQKIRRFIFNRDKKCLKCGSPDNLTIDHIMPISKGGKNIISNLQTLYKKCNSIKRANFKDYRNGSR